MRKLMGGLSSPLMPTINVYTNFLLSPLERGAPCVRAEPARSARDTRASPSARPCPRAAAQTYRRTIQEQQRDGVIRKSQAQTVRARARARARARLDLGTDARLSDDGAPPPQRYSPPTRQRYFAKRTAECRRMFERITNVQQVRAPRGRTPKLGALSAMPFASRANTGRDVRAVAAARGAQAMGQGGAARVRRGLAALRRGGLWNL